MSASLVTIAGDSGRIWTTQPSAEADGLLTVVQMAQSRPHGGHFTAVAFAPTAQCLAMVDSRGNVFAFHIKKNRFALLARAGVAGTAIGFSCRHKRDVYVAFTDRTVRSYDVETAQLLATLKGHHTPVYSIAVHPTQDALVTCSSDSVLMWDAQRWERKRTLGASSYGAVAAAFVPPAGNAVATAFRDDSLWVWDASSFALLAKLSFPLQGASAAGPLAAHFAIANDGVHLVAVGASPLLLVWDLVAKTLLYAVRLPTPIAQATQVHFMPDNRTVAVAVDTGSLLFVDVVAARLTARLGDGRRHVCTAFSIDARGNYAALVAEEGAVRLHDLTVLRKNTLATTELARVDTGAIADSLLRTSLPFGPPSAHAVGGEPLDDDEPDALLGEHEDPTLAEATFAARRKRKLAWADAPMSPVKGVGGVGVMCDGPDGAVQSTQLRATPRSPGGRASLKTHRMQPEERSLSRARLRTLLDAYGEYPEKHRLRIWKFLLEVPSNLDAHQALVNLGHHSAFDTLAQRFPIRDRVLLGRLDKTLSQLSHWAPVFAEVDYLPGLVFPFVKTMGADEKATFEVIATVLLNWARGWLDAFPSPPLRTLRAVEVLLEAHDPNLAAALGTMAGTAGAAGASWLLLQTAFTDVLAKSDWLKLWDHLLTNPPSFIYYAAAAYLIYMRDALMAARSEGELTALLTQNRPINLNAFIRAIYKLRQQTPESAAPPEHPLQTLPASDVYLPFQGYNKVSAAQAKVDRESLAAAEAAVVLRKATIAQLRQQTEALEKDQASWEAEKARMMAVEAERRLKLKLEDETLLAERIKLDNLEKAERVRQIAAVEEGYRRNLHRQRDMWRAELERLQQEVEHKQKETAYTVQCRMEDQSIQAMEFAARRRLWAMEEEAAQHAVAQRLRDEVALRRKQEELAVARQEEAWRLEDGERQVKAQAEVERRQRTAALNEELLARQQAEELLLTEQVHRDLRIAEVEKERRLRVLAEDEHAAMLAATEAARARESLLAREEAMALQATADASRRWHESQRIERAEELQREQLLVAREAEHRAMKLAEAERAQRTRDLEAALTEQRRALEKTNREEERATRDVLESLARERRRDQAAELELQLKQVELAERLKADETAALRQEAVLADERERFMKLREELGSKFAMQEGETRRRHEESMARMALEREKKLAELDLLWRQRVQKEELGALQQESATVEALRRQSAAVYGAREYELQREVAELHGSVALGEFPTAKAEGSMPFKAAEMSASLNALLGKTNTALVDSSLDALLKKTAVAARTPASVVSGSTMSSSELTGSTPYSSTSGDTTSVTASAMGPPPPRAPAAFRGLAGHPMMAGNPLYSAGTSATDTPSSLVSSSDSASASLAPAGGWGTSLLSKGKDEGPGGPPSVASDTSSAGGSTESARRSLAFNGAADATPAAGVAAATLGTAEPSVTFGSEVRNGVSSAAADGLGVSYEAAASTAGVTTDAARFWDSAEDVSGSHDRSVNESTDDTNTTAE